MSTLNGKSVASTYDQVVKRQDSYSATGNQIEIMDDSGVIKTTPLYLDSVNSRVGIGTAGPEEVFEVKIPSGVVNIGNLTADSITFGNNTSSGVIPGIYGKSETDNKSGLQIHAATSDTNSQPDMVFAVREDDGTAFSTLTTEAFQFTTYSTNLMTILRNGNVGIGDTSPSYQLELSTNSAAKPTSTLWTVPSDERLKDDIVLADLDKCYDIIQNLPLKRFKWKEDVYTNDQTDDRSVLGWIAQDVQSVFPKSVKENNFRGVSNNDAIQSIEAQDAVEWLDKPSEDNTKDEIKAWMDSNSLAYNSGDTKTDLIAKIPELKQEAIESVVGVDETYKLEIEDCLSIDADQIFRAMFGAIQKLQAKVEALESK